MVFVLPERLMVTVAAPTGGATRRQISTTPMLLIVATLVRLAAPYVTLLTVFDVEDSSTPTSSSRLDPLPTVCDQVIGVAVLFPVPALSTVTCASAMDTGPVRRTRTHNVRSKRIAVVARRLLIGNIKMS